MLAIIIDNKKRINQYFLGIEFRWKNKLKGSYKEALFGLEMSFTCILTIVFKKKTDLLGMSQDKISHVSFFEITKIIILIKIVNIECDLFYISRTVFQTDQ